MNDEKMQVFVGSMFLLSFRILVQKVTCKISQPDEK